VEQKGPTFSFDCDPYTATESEKNLTKLVHG